MTKLDYTHIDGIATISLNNPPQNRLSSDVTSKLGAAILDISQRKDTRVVYFKAEGENFGFGGDINDWTKLDSEGINTMISDGIKLVNLFEDLPVPIVIAVQGHCLGGAFEMVLRGDIIVAADNAKFGHPEATVGVFTLLGGIQRVAERVGRTRAMQWALTCELIEANHAQELGLINEVVPLDQLEETAEAWVQRLAAGPTLAHADHKKLLRAWSDAGVHAADALMGEMAGKTMFSEDAQGSIAAAIAAAKEGKLRPAYPFKGK